jgi:periplasmic protein TonB
MFEDSLVESTGRIRTRSKWFAIGSFLLQAALLAALILIPYFYPAALPKQALTMMLTAPPPPPAPAELPARAATARTATPVMLAALTAPSVIPQHPAMIDDRPPGAIDVSGGDRGSGNGLPDALWRTATPPPVVPEPKPKPAPGPLRISAGVAAGRLIVPIRPMYPAIARNAHIQGTVVVEATISKDGIVEHARVVSGHPMLAGAALNAIVQAHYQPYKLNGDPVEVETTINVIFTLNE